MTKAAEQCREYVEANWVGTPVGRFSCRDTASGGISQHSAYLGYDSNALDIFGLSHGTGAADTAWIQSIVDDLTAHLHDWSIRKILWQQKDHYDHAHVDFYPMCTTHKWCGRAITPGWRLSSGSTFNSRDPQPENGLYDGEGSPTVPPQVPDEEAKVKEYIEAQQENLNLAGFRDKDGHRLVVDGIYGARTKYAQASRDVAAAEQGGGGAHTHPFTGVTGSA